eukprot:m.640036 g.640036  ORF g.640036 m.640036 type:complete len:565 (-) comp22619_c0_seq10:2618-4312(-)
MSGTEKQTFAEITMTAADVSNVESGARGIATNAEDSITASSDKVGSMPLGYDTDKPAANPNTDGSDSLVNPDTGDKPEAGAGDANGIPTNVVNSNRPKKSKNKKRTTRSGPKRHATGADRPKSKDDTKDMAADQYSTRNLYIRGLSPETTNESLHDMFGSFGKIISTKAVASKDRPLECRGYGFVMFESAENASSAVETLRRQGVAVQFAKISPRSHYSRKEDPTNLYFSNLPLRYEETHLKDLLAPFGKVISCRILRDMNSQASRGVGFARMESRVQCENIVSALGGAKLEDSPEPLLCKFADSPQQRKGNGSGDGDFFYHAFRGTHNGLLSPNAIHVVHGAGSPVSGMSFGYDQPHLSPGAGSMTPWALMSTAATPFSPGGEYRDGSLYDYGGLTTGPPIQYTDIHGRSVYIASEPTPMARTARGSSNAQPHMGVYHIGAGTGGDGPAVPPGYLSSPVGAVGTPLGGAYGEAQPVLLSIPADGIIHPGSPGAAAGAEGGYSPVPTQYVSTLPPGAFAPYSASGGLLPGQYVQKPVEPEVSVPSIVDPGTHVPTESVDDGGGQ